MKKTTIGLIAVLALLLLAACNGTAGEGGSNAAGLHADYQDALPVANQLALGSLRLEGTDQAIDEEQAGQVLPLWQAYQAMSGSETAATAELTALVEQIQDTMTDEQVAAIAAMALTEDDAAAWMQESGAGFGRGALTGGEGADESGTGRAFPDAGGGFAGGQGMGRPEGGVMAMPGGVPGAGMGTADADGRATRLAELGGDADELMATMRNQVLVNGLVRSLQVKTGELDEDALQPRAALAEVWNVVVETSGIPLETLQSEMAAGATLAEVIAARDGDLAAVEQALFELFSELPDVEQGDIEARVQQILDATMARQQVSE